MKKRIKNLDDLQAERVRLEYELERAESVLKEDLHWLKDEMKPEKIVVRAVKNIFGTGKNGVVGEGVRFTIGSIVRSILPSKLGWISKLVIPFFVSNISTNLMSDKKPEMLDVLKNLIHKARKYTKDEDKLYDKSTVDEMDY